jgi:hypothetical protein
MDIQNIFTGFDNEHWNLGIKMDYQPFSKFYLDDNGRHEFESGYPKIYLESHVHKPVETVKPLFYSITTQIDWMKEWFPRWKIYLSGNYTYTSEHTPDWQRAVLTANDLYYTLPWYKSLLPSTGKSFETVYDGEFVAPSIIGFQIRQSVENIYISQSFRPELSWVLRAARGLPGKTAVSSHSGFQKNLWETGLEVDNLLNINLLRFGLGAYYRLGEYAYPDKLDNFSLRLKVSLGKLSF